MRTVALSAERWVAATRQAAGVQPYSFPPHRSGVFPVWTVAAADFLYVNLHGTRGGRAWLGDRLVEALTEEQARGLRLGGTVVFVASCYGVEEDGRPSPMARALLDAGAAALAAGPGVNYGGIGEATGVDTLGRWFRVLLGAGLPAGMALELAKLPLRLGCPRPRLPEADALGFRLLGDTRATARRVNGSGADNRMGHR